MLGDSYKVLLCIAYEARIVLIRKAAVECSSIMVCDGTLLCGDAAITRT